MGWGWKDTLALAIMTIGAIMTAIGVFFELAGQKPAYAQVVPQGPQAIWLAHFLLFGGIIIFGVTLFTYAKGEIVVTNPRDLQIAERERELQRARNLEVARRYEAAARIYERYEMFKEAGRVRAKKIVRIKETKVTVDLNDLLKQVKNLGMVVLYRCPHCGGNIKITGNTPASSLHTCQYCKSTLSIIDLIGYLRSALS